MRIIGASSRIDGSADSNETQLIIELEVDWEGLVDAHNQARYNIEFENTFPPNGEDLGMYVGWSDKYIIITMNNGLFHEYFPDTDPAEYFRKIYEDIASRLT